LTPQAAARIHVNDPQRIQRALEVHRITGQTISELQQRRVSAFTDVKVIEFALAPLNAASYTPRSNSDLKQCSRPVSWRKSGACTKEAI